MKHHGCDERAQQQHEDRQDDEEDERHQQLGVPLDGGAQVGLLRARASDERDIADGVVERAPERRDRREPLLAERVGLEDDLEAVAGLSALRLADARHPGRRAGGLEGGPRARGIRDEDDGGRRWHRRGKDSSSSRCPCTDSTVPLNALAVVRSSSSVSVPSASTASESAVTTQAARWRRSIRLPRRLQNVLPVAGSVPNCGTKGQNARRPPSSRSAGRSVSIAIGGDCDPHGADRPQARRWS